MMELIQAVAFLTEISRETRTVTQHLSLMRRDHTLNLVRKMVAMVNMIRLESLMWLASQFET